jgi:hypothetical protein
MAVNFAVSFTVDNCSPEACLIHSYNIFAFGFGVWSWCAVIHRSFYNVDFL